MPAEDVAEGTLRAVGGTTVCEWKGTARYFDVVGADGRVATRAAWTYPEPVGGFTALAGHVAFMPAAMDRCTVDGEVATPQEGGFYGGWITSHVAGPFKGGAGSRGW